MFFSVKESYAQRLLKRQNVGSQKQQMEFEEEHAQAEKRRKIEDDERIRKELSSRSALRNKIVTPGGVMVANRDFARRRPTPRGL